MEILGTAVENGSPGGANGSAPPQSRAAPAARPAENSRATRARLAARGGWDTAPGPGGVWNYRDEWFFMIDSDDL